MKRLPSPRALLPLMLCATLSAGPALGQDRADERQLRSYQLQMRQLQLQLQEATAAKTRLESENAELGQRIEDAERQASAANGARRRMERKLRAAEVELGELAASLQGVRSELARERQAGADALAERDRQLADGARAMRELQQRENDLQERFREQLRLVSACTDKNERLVKLGAELIDRYQGKGLQDVLRQREPVLGLADVEMFNLVQQYRDRVEAERFSPSVAQ